MNIKAKMEKILGYKLKKCSKCGAHRYIHFFKGDTCKICIDPNSRESRYYLRIIKKGGNPHTENINEFIKQRMINDYNGYLKDKQEEESERTRLARKALSEKKRYIRKKDEINEKSKKRYLELKKDPEALEKKRKRDREARARWYIRLKSDPVKYAEYRIKVREGSRKRSKKYYDNNREKILEKARQKKQVSDM